AWHGEDGRPVALVKVPRQGYVMIDPGAGQRRRVDASIAATLAPDAVTFYPTLPSRPLGFRDLVTFALRHSRGNIIRIVIAAIGLGLLSWVVPLITEALVNSAIPRTEIDQLTFCALALAATAIAMAGMQTVQAVAMLRLEGVIDWKLQSAIIDRLLRLPASVFREYTVGDFVNRSMGIDAIRRIFTGRTLRSLMAGLLCWFSVLLMVWYDYRLALIAIGLMIIRGLLIIITSAVRLYHENRQFDLQGKIGGLILQDIAGIRKLQRAAATVRALAVWSRQFVAQKRHAIASQRIANVLPVVETAFPTLAPLIIFATVSAWSVTLMRDLGAFLAFFAAFGQAMGAVGAWASGVSDSLVAIPHFTRIRPLISGEAEVS